jgi:hypothetical protein
MSRSLPNRPPTNFDFSGSKVIYHHGNRKVYKIREEYILKRVPFDINSEAATHRFVQSSGTSTPVPYIYDEWLSEDRKQHYILEGRIAGETVGDAWPRLSTAAKHSAARQVVTYMERLAQFRSDRLESVAHRRVITNNFVPKPLTTHLAGKWRTDAEIFHHEFRPALTQAGVSPSTMTLLQRTMPPCAGQLVFTHGDLYVGNVMVNPATAEITAIIDWESAGFWPAWFQYARITDGCTPVDGEWKALLSALMRNKIPHAEHGRVWWCAVQELLYDRDSGKGRAWVSLLGQYLRGEAVDLGRYKEVEVERSTGWFGTASRAVERFNGRRGRGAASYYSTALGTMKRTR